MYLAGPPEAQLLPADPLDPQDICHLLRIKPNTWVWEILWWENAGEAQQAGGGGVEPEDGADMVGTPAALESSTGT